MLISALSPKFIRTISPYAKRKLAQALRARYTLPVTGFLVDVLVISNAAVGITFCHVGRDGSGRFDDGHLIRTSDIVDLRRSEGSWIVTTVNSTYVVVTFKPSVGRPSLMALQRLMKSEISPTPRQVH